MWTGGHEIHSRVCCQEACHRARLVGTVRLGTPSHFLGTTWSVWTPLSRRCQWTSGSVRNVLPPGPSLLLVTRCPPSSGPDPSCGAGPLSRGDRVRLSSRGGFWLHSLGGHGLETGGWLMGV